MEKLEKPIKLAEKIIGILSLIVMIPFIYVVVTHSSHRLMTFCYALMLAGVACLFLSKILDRNLPEV